MYKLELEIRNNTRKYKFIQDKYMPPFIYKYMKLKARHA